MKALVAGTAVTGLPAVSEVKALQLTEHDVVVIKMPGYITASIHETFQKEWTARFPSVKCLLLGEGADIEILKGIK